MVEEKNLSIKGKLMKMREREREMDGYGRLRARDEANLLDLEL